MSGTPRPSAAATARLHANYRDLHAHPELSMQEHRTAGLVEERLAGLGLETFRCAGTGVVGVLRNGDGPVVAYRADTDALPVAEATGLPYASTATGTLPDGTEVPVMHACGHDAHTAVALAVAELLAEHRGGWAGTVVFVFQPGEETAVGARAMVTDGLWDRAPRPELVLGQHVGPVLAGTVLHASGVATATSDAWRVTVHGRGGHASRPENTIDPIVLAAHMVVRLQSIVSREVDPRQSAVLTVGTIRGGLKENVIPSTVELTVNLRALDAGVRDRVSAALHRVLLAEAAASGAPEPSIEHLYAFPRCVNDPAATERAVRALRAELGAEAVTESPPFMGSEDFGHFGETLGVASVYWLFGGASAESLASGAAPAGNHSPGFAPALEPTLSTGVRAAAAVLLDRLRTH